MLVKGLIFSINPKKLNYTDYCVNFETLFRNSTLEASKIEYIKTRLNDLGLPSYKEYNDFSHRYDYLSNEEKECLKKLSSNKNIVIQNSHKGNSFVTLNKSDYTGRVK